MWIPDHGPESELHILTAISRSCFGALKKRRIPKLKTSYKAVVSRSITYTSPRPASVSGRKADILPAMMGSDSEPDRKTGDGASPGGDLEARRDSTSIGAEDAAILPTGVLDPVYDAKARVLNHAVSLDELPHRAWSLTGADPRHRHGLVSVAALHCCWLWLGC